MKNRRIWEGMEIWPHEPGDREGPPNTRLAEYVADAYIGEELRRALVTDLRDPNRQLAGAARRLVNELDNRVAVQEALAWVKEFTAMIKTQPNANHDDVADPSKLPPIMVRGLFWVYPDDVANAVGWRIIGERRRKRAMSCDIEYPDREMPNEASNEIDSQSMKEAPSGDGEPTLPDTNNPGI